MVASSTAIMAAQRNEDLKARAKALGATLGMTGGEVEAAWDQIVIKPVDEEGQACIASVLEYAQAQYDKAFESLPPEPGVDESMVTDAHILFALTPPKTETTTESPSYIQ